MLFKYVLRLAFLLGCAGFLVAQQEQKRWVFHGDQPVDSQPIRLAISGLVRQTDGEPLHSAVIEVQMNPYHPGPTSERALAVTDAYGRYQVTVNGHHGAVRVRVAREGFQPAAREMHYIKSSRDLAYNFSLPAERQPR